MARKKHNFTKSKGPFATVRVCGVCGFVVRTTRTMPGAGRGYGLWSNSKAQAEMINHLKSEHPDEAYIK